MRFTEKEGRKLYQRETDADRKGKKVGRWSRTEHLRFVQALQKFGRADSWKVQEFVGTRTGKQIQSHAQKYFSKVQAACGGALPDEKQLADLEGINLKSCSEIIPSSAQDTEKDEAYLSDTGKLVANATKERDEYVKSRRGRHRKKDLIKIAALDSIVI